MVGRTMTDMNVAHVQVKRAHAAAEQQMAAYKETFFNALRDGEVAAAVNAAAMERRAADSRQLSDQKELAERIQVQEEILLTRKALDEADAAVQYPRTAKKLINSGFA